MMTDEQEYAARSKRRGIALGVEEQAAAVGALGVRGTSFSRVVGIPANGCVGC
jgi:hypothetical protein